MKKVYLLFGALLVTCTTVFAQSKQSLASQKATEIINKKLHIDEKDSHNNHPSLNSASKTSVSTEINVINTAAVESEVHAAINPTDSNNIIISSIQNGTAGFSTPIYYTNDFGATWQQSTFVTEPKNVPNPFVAGGGDPVLIFDKNGTAYMTWINLYFDSNADLDTISWGLYWAFSTDGGATWQRGTREDIAFSTANANDFGSTDGVVYDKQWFAVDNSNSAFANTVYCTFFEVDVPSSNLFIGIRKKDPAQTDFTNTSVNVSGPSFTNMQFANLGVDHNGTVHVSFFGTQDGNNYALWHASSTDGAATFSTPTKITDVNIAGFTSSATSSTITGVDDDRFYPSPYMAVDQNNGNIYMTWTASGVSTQLSTGNDIYFTRSTDGGATWDTPKVVNDNKDPNSDEFYSSIYVDATGDLSISWYDKTGDANNINTEYYMAYSTDGGLNFNRAKVTTTATDFGTVGNINNGFGIGEYTQIISSDGHLIPVWSDGRLNNGNLDIYVSFIPKSNTIGIHETSTLNSRFNVSALYPNPVIDELKFDISVKQNTNIAIQVLNQNGQVVLDNIEESLSAGTHTISTPVDLASGNYFLSVTSKQGIAVKKFIVQ